MGQRRRENIVAEPTTSAPPAEPSAPGPDRADSARLAYLALGGAALFWAGNFIVGRALRGDVPPIALTFWRWAFALVIVGVVFGRSTIRDLDGLRADGRRIVALAVTGVVGFQLAVYFALTATTAINATLLVSLTPVVIVAISRVALHDTINRTQGLGLLVSFLGAAVVVVRGDLGALGALSLNRGDLLMVAAVILWATYTVLLRRRPFTVSPASLVTATTAIGVALLTPLYLWSLAAGQRMTLTAGTAVGIGYVGVFASVLAFLFWNRGVAVVGANRAGLFLHLMPLFGAALSFLFLGEGIEPYHLAGGALVATGLVLTARGR